MTVPELPRTWRPRLATWIALGLAVVVAAGSLLLALSLPGGGATPYHAADRVGIAAIGVALAAGLVVMARPRLTVDATGLTVVNLLRSRRLDWAEVVSVGLATTSSWASLDLADGTTLPVMALQTADGERTRVAMRQLAALIAARTPPDPSPPAA